MLFFGHLGFGEALRISCAPKGLREKLVKPETVAFLLGTLLPDLIDKPLYAIVQRLVDYEFILSDSALASLITSTRTFGHTVIFLLLTLSAGLVLKKYWKSSSLNIYPFNGINCGRFFLLLGLGMLSHLLIDPISDQFRDGPPIFGPEPWFFPLHGFRFQERMFDPSWTLAKQILQPSLLLMEMTGAGFLAWRYLRGKREVSNFPHT